MQTEWLEKTSFFSQESKCPKKITYSTYDISAYKPALGQNNPILPEELGLLLELHQGHKGHIWGWLVHWKET